jgi:hypothetical protein
MTDDEQMQLKKDVLYNEHESRAELNACVVKLERLQAHLQKWSEHLKNFTSAVGKLDLPIETAAKWRAFPEVNLSEVVAACDETISVRIKLDGIRSQKRKLSL